MASGLLPVGRPRTKGRVSVGPNALIRSVGCISKPKWYIVPCNHTNNILGNICSSTWCIISDNESHRERLQMSNSKFTKMSTVSFPRNVWRGAIACAYMNHFFLTFVHHHQVNKDIASACLLHGVGVVTVASRCPVFCVHVRCAGEESRMDCRAILRSEV